MAFASYLESLGLSIEQRDIVRVVIEGEHAVLRHEGGHWSTQNFNQELPEMETPALNIGWRAEQVDDHCTVLVNDRRQPDISCRLLESGASSELVLGYLNAIVLSGRNILFCGDADGARNLVEALAQEAPAGFRRLGSAAPKNGIDSRPCDLLALSNLPRFHQQSSSFSNLGFCGAPSIELALMEQEFLADAAAIKNIPLVMLKSFNVLVDVGAGGYVIRIAELNFAPGGYQPHWLFLRDPDNGTLCASQHSLWHENLCFLDEGLRAGDWRPRNTGDGPQAPRGGGEHDSLRGPNSDDVDMNPLSAPSAPPASTVGVVGEDLAPGWELDQLADNELAADMAVTRSAEEAELAAAYGLGPPPSPSGGFHSVLKRLGNRKDEHDGS